MIQISENNKTKYILLILLLIAVLTVRLPNLLPDISFNNDAPVYSENMEKDFFDGTYSVHSPGYVLYIYIGRFFYIFIKNTVIIQHIINILLIFIITVLFYFFLGEMGFTDIESFIFSILFSMNNILLLGSVTGGNRLFLTLASILFIYLSIKIIRDDKKKLIILFSIIFALLIGVRQDISFYFFPLFILVLIKVRNLKYIIFSLLLFGITCFLWLIPLLMEYGGLMAYLQTTAGSESVKNTSIIFSGLKLSPILNITRMFIYMFNSILFILPIFIYLLVKKQFKFKRLYLIILILAFFPSFLFQALIHNGNFVHLSAFIAPLFLFLINGFKIDNNRKTAFLIILIIGVMIQFFGIRMFDAELPSKIDADKFETVILSKINKEDDRLLFIENYNLHKSKKYYKLDRNISLKTKTHMKNILYKNKYKIIKRFLNTIWLQYTFDGAKKGRTYRLRELVE